MYLIVSALFNLAFPGYVAVVWNVKAVSTDTGSYGIENQPEREEDGTEQQIRVDPANGLLTHCPSSARAGPTSEQAVQIGNTEATSAP